MENQPYLTCKLRKLNKLLTGQGTCHELCPTSPVKSNITNALFTRPDAPGLKSLKRNSPQLLANLYALLLCRKDFGDKELTLPFD